MILLQTLSLVTAAVILVAILSAGHVTAEPESRVSDESLSKMLARFEVMETTIVQMEARIRELEKKEHEHLSHIRELREDNAQQGRRILELESKVEAPRDNDEPSVQNIEIESGKDEHDKQQRQSTIKGTFVTYVLCIVYFTNFIL